MARSRRKESGFCGDFSPVGPSRARAREHGISGAYLKCSSLPRFCRKLCFFSHFKRGKKKKKKWVLLGLSRRKTKMGFDLEEGAMGIGATVSLAKSQKIFAILIDSFCGFIHASYCMELLRTRSLGPPFPFLKSKYFSHSAHHQLLHSFKLQKQFLPTFSSSPCGKRNIPRCIYPQFLIFLLRLLDK